MKIKRNAVVPRFDDKAFELHRRCIDTQALILECHMQERRIIPGSCRPGPCPASLGIRSQALCFDHAPLAQSVERFHGKEEVVSSILTGGSQFGPEYLGAMSKVDCAHRAA